MKIVACGSKNTGHKLYNYEYSPIADSDFWHRKVLKKNKDVTTQDFEISGEDMLRRIDKLIDIGYTIEIKE